LLVCRLLSSPHARRQRRVWLFFHSSFRVQPTNFPATTEFFFLSRRQHWFGDSSHKPEEVATGVTGFFPASLALFAGDSDVHLIVLAPYFFLLLDGFPRDVVRMTCTPSTSAAFLWYPPSCPAWLNELRSGWNAGIFFPPSGFRTRFVHLCGFPFPSPTLFACHSFEIFSFQKSFPNPLLRKT